jgi:glycerophosphoryl diester phosphodiesterase
MKTRFIFLSCIFIVLSSCKKNISLKNLNGNEVGCFGHAGMGSKSIYPANTLQSFQTCLSRGADGTEMDIQVTKDGVLVIFHDTDLSTETKCGGVIRDLNWEDIKNCRINSHLFNDLSVISFDEFMQNIENPFSYVFTFDCKLTPGDNDDNEYYANFSSSIVNTIEKYGLQECVFIENSDAGFLNLIKQKNSAIKVFLLAEDFDSSICIAVKNNFYGLSISNSNISANQINIAHKKNMRVTLYGVETDKENYDAITKQPDYIQSDDINYLLKLFGKFKRNSGRLKELFSNLSSS